MAPSDCPIAGSVESAGGSVDGEGSLTNGLEAPAEVAADSGSASVLRALVGADTSALVDDGVPVTPAAATGSADGDPNVARAALLGGEPLDGPRYISWNFVSSSRERLQQAAEDWRHQRFDRIPEEDAFIPLPEDGSEPVNYP